MFDFDYRVLFFCFYFCVRSCVAYVIPFSNIFIWKKNTKIILLYIFFSFLQVPGLLLDMLLTTWEQTCLCVFLSVDARSCFSVLSLLSGMRFCVMKSVGFFSARWSLDFALKKYFRYIYLPHTLDFFFQYLFKVELWDMLYFSFFRLVHKQISSSGFLRGSKRHRVVHGKNMVVRDPIRKLQVTAPEPCWSSWQKPFVPGIAAA